MKKTKLACILSKIAYKKEFDIYLDVCKLRFIDCYCIEKNNVFCYILKISSKEIFIVFRGSNDIQDWLGNMNINIVAGIHEGFREMLNEIFIELSNYIFYKFTNKINIYLTGHSMGGALASLCAIRLRKIGFKNIQETYTFGQPNYCNRTFKNKIKDLNLKFLNYINNNDIVPTLPKQLTVCGEIIYINSKGEIENNLSFVNKYKDKLLGFLKALFKDGKIDYIDDHKIDNYIKSLVGSGDIYYDGM